MRKLALLMMAFKAGLAMAEPADLPECPFPITVGYYGCCYFHQQDAGVDVEMFQVLMARAGCGFHVHDMPRARVWHELNYRSLDMTSMGIATPERSEYAWFLPYLNTKYLAAYRKDVIGSALPEDVLRDDRIVIGMVRSFKHGEAIDALVDAVRARRPDRVVEVADELTLFRLLKGGRVQLIFAERHLFDYAVQALGIDDAVQADIAPYEPRVARCLVLSKMRFSEDEMLKWKRLLDGMVGDGTVKLILSRYVPPRDVPEMLLSPVIFARR